MTTKKIAQLSLLSAACVVGRIIFQLIPNVQPMTAIFLFVVLYFGLQDALLVMTLSLLLSNLYFGIGPWMIGQWISFSLVLALFWFVQTHIKREKKWLTGSCFFLAGLFFGLFMTIFDSILYQLTNPFVYYIQGLSFDLFHATGNLVFFLLALPVIERFDRLNGRKK
ncbi:hypothetical protein F6X86_03125 [Enterococcus durans]|uniref:Integral membrane protein n=1 Tax=Enterococcus durans TaxID=53345 RepID=A0A5N0YUM5_9ENTE|nr:MULTISPECIES: hypothetical protein [Enterococcus]KAA9180177.1 hypothetical protein F6X86_03125 [Enterococcus durans]KAA9187303.1 hypothetical protein F6X85_03715 [Enterococcus durans]KAA9187472.1 hypothetical protein F6X90_03755 [Enterococcus durans]KAA9192367.1 hypothetical protein F6Y12_04800 [Enterococcus durans]KAA9194602.1 hypothetical protein F6X87_05665 [Enterococcus durans]